MTVPRVIAIAVSSALVVLALLAVGAYVVGPGVGRGPLAALEGHAHHGRGHHGQRRDPCAGFLAARFDVADVDRHLAGATGWLGGALDLDAAQRAALAPIAAAVRDWVLAVRAACPLPEGDARALVASAARVAAATAAAATRIDAAFAAFYDTLAPAQRAIVDGWSRHGQHGGLPR